MKPAPCVVLASLKDSTYQETVRLVFSLAAAVMGKARRGARGWVGEKVTRLIVLRQLE